jgi:hypothetical protein
VSGRFRELQYFGEWPPYQRAALAAFEKGRHHGRASTHIVSPPGSGTTILGVELIRRIGRRALVLCPNQAVQQQWPKAVSAFTAQPWSVVGPDPLKPIACLTYQGLCDIEDPELVLGRLAQSRWADERAAATGITPEEAMREFESEEADQRARELARIQGVLKREVAQGEAAGLELRDLLSTVARERVQQLAKLGVNVVVLDECHHLASLWGYVIRAVLGALGDDVHVVGLTPTPPVGLPEADAELYAALLGPVDFTVPTPAVVRDGQLAPYQELVWLTEPVAAEQGYLAEHDARFLALTASLREDPAFTDWVRDAVPKRPRLAGAAARLFGEGERPPELEDWLRLLETYALRQLAPQDSPEARDAYDEIAAALRELGCELTARGVPRGLADADRLLTSSQAKPAGMLEILAAEAATRGDRFRGLVMCDTESAEPRPDDALTGILDLGAITARHALHAIAADPRTAAMRPLLVSSRGLRCVPEDADVLLEALRKAAEERFALPEWEVEPEGLLVTLRSSGAEWMPRVWVELATTLLVDAVTKVLVGTRRMVGDDWVCAPLNVLVDLTVAEAGASVQAVRGRTLRLDRGNPHKVASNWEVVCAAPERVRGHVDYARFARKQAQLFALADDGTVVAGTAHVHPELDPSGPPPAARFAAINADQLARAGDRAAARERWQVGTPYRGVELPTLLVRALEPQPLPLQGAGRAIAEAYRELGEITPEAAGSLRVAPTGSQQRVELAAASAAEGRSFVVALDELAGRAPDAPTLLISRPLGGSKLLGRVLRRAATGAERLHPVPADFARDEQRTEAFARAWAKHVGPGRVLEEPGRAPDGGYETLIREVWV